LRGGDDKVEINMGPLIDMVFLLLIFFVVTTSFVKESGIDVHKSTAATAEVKERGSVMIGINSRVTSIWKARKLISVAFDHLSNAPWQKIQKAPL